MTSVATERVLGWDVLRGLCALGVAVYHLLYWQGIAQLHTLGSYGVYLFFVLSGASLAYNYLGRIAGMADAGEFLVTRFLRIAPLYWVVSAIVLAVMLDSSAGVQGTSMLLWRLVLNLSFLFGFHEPTLAALPVGGWSLGIEFIYYLAFPVLLSLLARRWLWKVTAVLLIALQWYWIERTVGSAAGYASSSVAYHHVPAFAAYFFGGCVIGAARRHAARDWPIGYGAATWIGMAALLLALNPMQQGMELVGARGGILFAACFAVVFASGQVRVTHRLKPVARWLGDITYGCYLLHPVFFFGFAWYLWPRFEMGAIAQAPTPTRMAVLACVLLVTCLAAWASERWLEAPVRRLGKRLLKRVRRPAQPHIDAASISS